MEPPGRPGRPHRVPGVEMESGLVMVVGLAFLAAGLGIGLVLWRAGRAAAVAAAAPLGELQARVLALTEQLSRARAEVEGERARREDVARELGLARSAGERGQSDLDAALRAQADLRSELARSGAELATAGARLAEAAEAGRSLGARLEALEVEARRLGEERTRLATALDAERRAAEERRAEAEKGREQVRAEVEKLAGRLLEQQGRALLDRSQEGLEALLKPLGEKLKDFERKVEQTHTADTQERATLREHLRGLQEAQVRLHRDAEALTRALTRDSKQQGDWGEIVLERVLEGAGLERGREYELQVSHTDDDGGRRRPDALVYLPEERAVVVDAKCSLTAFVEASRATDDEAREAALDAHLASVKAHVRSLAGKSYTEVLRQRSLDFVMMFVPSEAAFLAALSRAPGLYEEAFRLGVVLASPTTLMAALRLIAQLWRTERQSRNAKQIADEAGKLLEKLTGFVAALDEVGTRLRQAQAAFSDARSKLSEGNGNVLRRAARIAELGAPVQKKEVRDLLAAGRADVDAEADREEAPAAPAAN